jgi:hypothetical protein
MMAKSRPSSALRRDFSFLAAALAVVAVLAPPRPARAHDQILEAVQERAHVRRLDRSRTWQVLLHYRRTARGGYRSEADGAGFFNAGLRGKTDPAAELDATLAAFRRPAVPEDPARLEESQHPQCRFPARWAWLKQALGIDPADIPDQPCPLFERWRKAFSADRITLVYATSYISSPASMYGHTFLRLTRATGEGNPLLDYIVNFAADIDTENGLLYAVKGLMGGFRGRFYVMPYYVKIQEYSNIESRDLWEYELSLTAAQAERLVAHTWETRTTHFEYFFFSENCSYFLLTLLEAADPRLHLSDRFVGRVIPADTVRAVLAVPGLVTRNWPRPSMHAEMTARRGTLASAEIVAAEGLAGQGGQASPQLAGLTPARQARVLDAANDLLRYREGMKAVPSQEFARKERQILVLRGRTGEPPLPTGAGPGVDAPERGHGTLRLGAAGGLSRAGAPFTDLDLRFAIHDFLDPVAGYNGEAVLEMAHLRLRAEPERQRVFAEQIDLVNIVSAVPFDRWAPKPSWHVRAGGRQARELGCDGWDCLVAAVFTGGGVSFRPARWALGQLMAESEAAAGAAFQQDYRVGLGGAATAVLRWGARAQTEATARYLYYFLGDARRHPIISLGQAVNLGHRAQLRLVGEKLGAYAEGRLELFGYF